MAGIRGKKAIVTGGAMGIGLATAKRLLSEGCDVAIWDLNAAALKKAEEELKSFKPGKSYAYQCDVTDNKAVLKTLRKTMEDLRRIDILINNAGIERHGRFSSKPISDWERVIDVNLKAMFYTTHAILPHMYERNSGYIVNISSAAGIIGAADLAAYCATKWGAWGFTESLRFEVEEDQKDIQLTSIHPHYLKEGLFAGGHLNWFGDLLLPRLKSHDVVAKAIVNKAIKKKRNTVKIPITLHIGVICRGLLPDSVFTFMAVKFFGIGKAMAEWVGYQK